MKNIKFQIALLESGLRQRDLAKKTGINEALISLGVRNRYIFNEQQKEKICKVLQKPANELFSNQ